MQCAPHLTCFTLPIHAISSTTTIKLLGFGIEHFRMRKDGCINELDWNKLRMHCPIAHSYYNIYAVRSSLNLFHTGLLFQSYHHLLKSSLAFFNIWKESYIIGLIWNELRMDCLNACKYYNLHAVRSTLNLLHSGLLFQSHHHLI
jgi:hypothetical protein